MQSVDTCAARLGDVGLTLRNALLDGCAVTTYLFVQYTVVDENTETKSKAIDGHAFTLWGGCSALFPSQPQQR